MNQTDNMKNVSNSKENNLQADVVIVGTGVGGCFSALNLSEDLSIIMIMTVISKTQCGLVIMKTGKSL